MLAFRLYTYIITCLFAGDEMSLWSSVKESLSSVYIQGALLIGLFVFVRWRLQVTKKKAKKLAEGVQPGSACSNPNCIRCCNYLQVLQKARSSFTHIFVRYRSSLLQRIDTALSEDHYEYANELQKPNVFYMEKLTSQAIWHPNSIYADDLNTLEANFAAISSECAQVEKMMNEDESGWTWNITQSGSWATFQLYNQGTRIERNCQQCPNTVEAIDILQNAMVTNLFGNAYFSIVGSDTVIEDHFGPTNIRLRCHLGK